MVAQTRKIAKNMQSFLYLSEELTESEYHEVRFCGLLISVSQFEKAKSTVERKKYFDFYLKQLKAGFINNWDLIDVTGVRMGSVFNHREIRPNNS
jgi:hypothetical protein